MKAALLQLLVVLFWSSLRLPAATASSSPTNVARLSAMSRLELNRGQPFSLTGLVTMVDSQRHLFVLQDETGAIGIYPEHWVQVSAGTRVHLRARSGVPYVVNFPDYPWRPCGSDIQPNFEAPSNWGEYHLARLSGYLHPPVTGKYSFWIASDNSSELWLSTDEQPSQVRLIALLRAGLWVNPHEWARYPSQSSEPILLRADRSYYIEAFTEQLEQAEHLAVAWEGPGISRRVIPGGYLQPWGAGLSAGTNGLQREYWTNFALGSLAAITGERLVGSGVSARGVQLEVIGSNVWPRPVPVTLGQQLAPELMYRWVETEGALDFLASQDGRAELELRAGQGSALVHVAHWRGTLAGGTNLQVRVEGVCEGVATQSGATVPGLLWANSEDQLRVIEMPRTNAELVAAPPATPAVTSAPFGGFFLARGVVTFNGRALTNNYLVVQDANSGVFIAAPEGSWPGAHLRAGDSVEIGGNLLRGRYAPRLRPEIVNLLGKHLLPDPATPDPAAGATAYRDGQWTELEGVGRQLLTNGVLLFHRKADRLLLAVANASRAELSPFIDATLRVRGVMSLDTPDEQPLLLVPSPKFVQVLEAPVTNLPVHAIGSVAAAAQARFSHRLRVSGVVTYQDPDLLVVQDDSGALQVRLAEPAATHVGDAVEVTGFPEQANDLLLLTQATVRRSASRASVLPCEVDSGEALAAVPNQALVRLSGELLSHKQSGTSRMLEVQLGHNVVQAVLVGQGEALAALVPGSLVRLTGVYVLQAVSLPAKESAAWESVSAGTIHLLLRSAADVTVLRGPPWWSWRKAALLIGVLLALLVGTVLRGQLLRRRFEKQQAARQAFARQLLENQENERRRIAANLHDTLGQNLLAIKNQAHLALQSALGDSGLQHRLEEISGTVLHTLEEVRQITHDLRPYQLDRLGLSQALRALVRKAAEASPIELASHVDELDGLFAKEAEMHLYRIVQEGLNNVLKHSQATEAAVVLKVEHGWLSISIRDNGRGLERNGTGGAAAPGFGLGGIEERAAILGGRSEVDAPTGEGFNLKIQIPLPSDSPTPAKDHGSTPEVTHR